MLRGGVASHGLLLGALLATPACGFIVGFEARDLCSDCPGDGGAAGSDAGGSLGTDSSLGGSDVNGASAGGATSGAQTSPSSASSSEGGSGGSGLSDGDSTTGTSGTETVGGAGGTDAVGGTGGMSDGGTGGGTETVTGTGTGTGGTSTGSTNTGSTSAGGTGTGGTSSGGDGGVGGGTDDTSTTTTTTSVGGSTGVGGSGGSGGTGGAPSPCEVETPFDASATDGVYPSDLMLGRGNLVRPWALTWVASDDVYFASYDDDGYAEFPPAVIDGSGTHSASVVTTQGQYAYVAYGELAASEARIVMNVLNPLSPGVPEQATTATLDGEAAPDVLGIALKGATSDTLVAAIDADKAGVLAWFSDGAYDMLAPVPGPLAALVPLDLGESFAAAFVEDGTLQVSLVSYDSPDIELPQDISDSVQTNSERPVAGVSLANGAALVWVESDGIYLTTLDESGDPAPNVRVSYGTNDVLPMVAAVGSQLMVSWIDAETDTLYMRRFPAGLSGSAEAQKVVMTQVAETRYGFAADTFTATKATFGFVFAVDRLKVALVTCPI